MEMHPQLDVYTHAFEGLAGRTGIVFGKKRIGSNTKGRVCFMLLRQGVDLPRLELGRIIDGIHHAEPTKPHCIFSLDDTNVKIQEQIDTLFLGFKDTIGTYFTPNGARCLPLDFETGVC